VVGVSKSFNPELAKLTKGRSAAAIIANLNPFERTPAYLYKTDRVEGKFAVWYVRLRKSRQSQGPFDGIVKVEKILVIDHEVENGLDSSEVDNISATTNRIIASAQASYPKTTWRTPQTSYSPNYLTHFLT
jgi:hypothetical protein